MRARISAAFLGALLTCGALPAPAADDSPAAVLDTAAFHRHLATLASDEFDGRKPATAGEEKTVQYLRREFQAAGLKPGNGSTYFQSVPLVEMTADPNTALTVQGAKEQRSFKYATDMVVWTKRVVPESRLDKSDLVFVGYGIVAPEYGWDDYKSANIKGKTAVILVNDPGFITGDPKLFNGRAMTYHGRWTYKFEEAARQGAAGALIIHDTDAAAYGWDVVANGWTGPQLDMYAADGNRDRVAIEGWITSKTADSIFGLAGLDLAALRQAATKSDFKAVPLNLQASVGVRNSIRRSNSSNVIGILPGSERADEYILYTAHWDHLGHAQTGSGDTIFNGAMDNGTGVAGLLVIAQAFSRAQPKPERSIVFLAVTGEESNLLGSAYYAANPIYPLARTAAVINMDALYPGGPTRDVSVVGFGSSELEDELRKVAKSYDRVLTPEPEPERGYFYRSDHFSFAKQGVPALYIKVGIDDIEHGAEWGKQQAADYLTKHYHQPSDEYSPDLDLRGALDDIGLLYHVGYRLSREKRWPEWYKSNEFRAIRVQSDSQR